ncbi:MAG: HAMP domain-containing histidine kinase [Lachnospiraceae bacterium]|nr:HAMP domain-containing histidine kinase [Lachnospiraceae bacterium]
MTLPFFKKSDKSNESEEKSIIASSSRLSSLSGIDITNFDVLRSLASDYTSVYYANLETGQAAVVSFDDRNMREVAVVFDETASHIDEFSRQYANKRVPPRFFQEFVDVVSLTNLRAKLSETNVFTYRFIAYKGDQENHFMMRASRIGESGPNIVVGFSDIEDQFNEEQRRSMELEFASNAKSEFLKNASHELMTPLNAINGFTEMALKVVEQDVVKEYLSHIHIEALKLTVQIRNLISMNEFSLIDRPPYYEEYPITDFFSNIKDHVTTPAKAKNIELTFDSFGIKVNRVKTDIEFLNRIFLHLIYNAIKYTDNGGTVILSVKQEMLDEKTVSNEFHVKDNGIGMSKEFSEHLFEAFSREKTSTEGAPPGMGLGLAITEKLVNALGGSISVVTKKDFGTDFKVVIPTKVV